MEVLASAKLYLEITCVLIQVAGFGSFVGCMNESLFSAKVDGMPMVIPCTAE